MAIELPGGGPTDHMPVFHGTHEELRASINRAEPPPHITGIGAGKAPKPTFKVAAEIAAINQSSPLRGTASPPAVPPGVLKSAATPAAIPPSPSQGSPATSGNPAPNVANIAAAVAAAKAPKPKGNKAI